MADKDTKLAIPATHEEITVDRPIRTADHNVFFPGRAVVNKRAVPGIDSALSEEARRTRSMEIEEEDEGDSKLLGDTRTSAAKEKAKSGKKRGK